MSASTVEASDSGVPESLGWDELQQLPDEIAQDIELWERKVIWNHRGPIQHQRFMRRLCNAIEANAQRAMQQPTDTGETLRWEVELETNVFFTPDKNSFLTPDFLVRRCSPNDDTAAADVALVCEVLSRSDTLMRRQWKMDRYAAAGIPWYWEVELDSRGSRVIRAVRAYELFPTPAAPVKLLRPAMYGLAGEWEPRDVAIDFPEPFGIYIAWEDLAY